MTEPAPPTVDQPDPLESVPGREASPAAMALHQARELFAQKWQASLPHTAQGAIALNLLEMALEVELDTLRISALANVLVAKGLVTAEELCLESTKLLNEKIEGLAAVLVARHVNGMNGKRVG